MKEKGEIKSGSLKDALIKKALGCSHTEVVEEYVTEEGEIKLTKKKVTTKNEPPDVTAIKLLIEEKDDLTEMTDEELEAEKKRLIGLLKKTVKEKKNDK